MSLKQFHIFFILTSLALLAFLAYWSGQRVLYYGENSQNLAIMIVAVSGLAAGVPYLGWFIKKSKHL